MALEFEDTHTIKFNPILLNFCEPTQQIIDEKRTVGGITWWIQYYPNGQTENEKGYVSIFFHLTGGPALMVRQCGVRIKGFLVQKVSTKDYEEAGSWGIGKWLSHEQCLQADKDKDGAIEFVFQVKFVKPNPNSIVPKKSEIANTFVTDSATVKVLTSQFEFNEIGDFDSTPKEFVKGSDKHQWQISVFPAGDSKKSAGYVSLAIDASTTETKTVILNGVISIKEAPLFKKEFRMIVGKDSILTFPKLVSHKELRQIEGIDEGNVTIQCDATFYTCDNFSLAEVKNSQ